MFEVTHLDMNQFTICFKLITAIKFKNSIFVYLSRYPISLAHFVIPVLNLKIQNKMKKNYQQNFNPSNLINLNFCVDFEMSKKKFVRMNTFMYV